MHEKLRTLAICVFTFSITVQIFYGVFFSPGHVVSSSMEPTVKTGDFVLHNRLAYLFNTPCRGDIICFEHDGEIWLKRVIGLPGEEIIIYRGMVYVDGKRIDESAYLDPGMYTYAEHAVFLVPKNRVFVLGDNRVDSEDSRFLANPYIKEEDIVGKLVLHFPLGV